MGIVKNVGYDIFPKQSNNVGKSVKVCFRYNTKKLLNGEIVRDDIEEPYQTIIKLENGKYILASECQYKYPG